MVFPVPCTFFLCSCLSLGPLVCHCLHCRKSDEQVIWTPLYLCHLKLICFFVLINPISKLLFDCYHAFWSLNCWKTDIQIAALGLVHDKNNFLGMISFIVFFFLLSSILTTIILAEILNVICHRAITHFDTKQLYDCLIICCGLLSSSWV